MRWWNESRTSEIPMKFWVFYQLPSFAEAFIHRILCCWWSTANASWEKLLAARENRGSLWRPPPCFTRSGTASTLELNFTSSSIECLAKIIKRPNTFYNKITHRRSPITQNGPSRNAHIPQTKSPWRTEIYLHLIVHIFGVVFVSHGYLLVY